MIFARLYPRLLGVHLFINVLRKEKKKKKYKCVSKKVKYYGTFFVKMVYLYENIIV